MSEENGLPNWIPEAREWVKDNYFKALYRYPVEAIKRLIHELENALKANEIIHQELEKYQILLAAEKANKAER